MENDQTQPISPITNPLPPVVTPTIHSISQKPSQLPVVLLSLLSLIFLSGMIYFYLQIQSLKQQLTDKPNPTPISITSPTPISSSDPTTTWKSISNKYWTFKVPSTLNSLECNSHDLLMVGSPTAASGMFTKDQMVECNFDQTGELLSVYRGLDNSENTIIVPTNIDPKIDPIVSEVKTILVDGNNAIFQKETTSFGQGTGSRYKVYVHIKNYMNVITFNNLSEKSTFDQILSTFQFTDSK